MPTKQPADIYWDASAVLSLLIADVHTPRARAALSPRHAHYLSTLAIAEVVAVLAREGSAEARLRRQMFWRDVTEGFWYQYHIAPPVSCLAELSDRHRLRGADLWHLASALTLRDELPGLRLLTFDLQLARAAAREDILFRE
ncbi:MAG: type II toxin-antitoxin system VapC family toxin [Deltaproteobacteria bacterium]|nr:type II toxin-antitoxin system VapC family toxin [Deltaproteobacteria bacterium]